MPNGKFFRRFKDEKSISWIITHNGDIKQQTNFEKRTHTRLHLTYAYNTTYSRRIWNGHDINMPNVPLTNISDSIH